ncbi:CWF19-like protein 2 [Colossoma macropomum]|uniref:CWF19-like protein 2 n=1 Tax=Colossoma macropomum TaxID=42526 RepID=UPI00186560E1|nr:CWF19-like protein 2 [Colossoma macropomum]
MAAYGGTFESETNIEKKKTEKRKHREQVLQQAKKKYEDEERRAAERKARGEDTWMLPEIDQRLQQIGQEHSLKSKTKKKEKSKKKKKEKKKKAKKEKAQEENGSSDSSEDSDEWVEAAPQPEGVDKAWKVSEQATPTVSATNSNQRDEWMTFDFLAMKTTSVAERRAQKEAEKEAERERERSVEQAGLHRLELNPYWKDGGSGLPPEESSNTALKKAVMVEDGGLSWLRKSYQRMKEQAEREQRRLDDIVAERYGSMEQFQRRLQEAEEAAVTQRRPERERGRREEGDEQRERWRRDSNRDGHREGERERERDRERDQGRDRGERERDQGRDREERERDQGRGREKDRERERERDGERDGEREERRSRELSLSSLRGRFLKPSDSDDPPTPATSWRKPGVTAAAASSNQSAVGFLKPQDEEDDDAPAWRKSSGGRELQEERERAREETEQQEKIQQQTSAALVEKSSSESDEDDGEDEEEAPLLTDEEMNKLGAKLVKAELMGNTALIDSLRAQLDAARKARENRPQKPPARPPSQGAVQAEADKDLVLFRTDHSGRAWPVSGPSQHVEPKGGRRKRKAIETHVSGERVRYFEDDDGVDLREMVRREKMSSAEDQNALYSRMAARMMGKQDGDNYTLDDMFVSSAAQKERAGLDEERQRSRAMEETRRLASRMEKCPHCFTNPELPKHLIIAIGAKVYLSLPNSVSLTEGHCLIAPLQHQCSSTGLDEDVWNEIQVFRRALVRMFEAQDLDCVFLETHMSPKRRLHLLYECVPLPRELGDTAPIYFKKALMECDEEWAMNKKVVDLSSKNIRQAVPRGLPYFSVDFGLQGGFAHVIENEQKFPHYFGKEVLGGMLDLEPRRWRKPIRENFDDQRKKVLQFSQWWKPFDCTKTDS